LPRFRRKQPPEPAPRLEIEAAIAVETFRPGPVARMVERGDRLPLSHPTVRTFPEFFRGLVSLEEVNPDGR
jgi:hypothetical protein